MPTKKTTTVLDNSNNTQPNHDMKTTTETNNVSAVNSTTPAIFWGKEADAVGNKFFGNDEKYFGAITSFATAIVINGQGDSVFGIYIKNEDMASVGWDKTKTHNGKVRNHTFKSKDGKPATKSPGLIFESPYLYVVDSSPRFIEIRRSNDMLDVKPELGKSGSIVGIHADRDGVIDSINAAFYDELKSMGMATLRTIYLIYFANEKGELLHKVPFALSVHGGAAYSISLALKAARESHTPVLSVDGFSHYIWNPQFSAELVGQGEQQYCTVVAKDEDGCYIQRYGICPDTLTELSENFESIRKANNTFSWKYLQQHEEWHPMALALKEQNSPTAMLSANNEDLDLGEVDPDIQHNGNIPF